MNALDDDTKEAAAEWLNALVAMLHGEGHESTKKSAADALRAIVESGGNLSVQVVDKLLAWRR